MPAGRHETLWIVDFPAFEWNEGERRWDAVHHPFTTPTGDFSDPGSMSSRAYDLVLDGTEIGGGSIRIHRPEVQQEVFKVLGISEAEAEERFGFLLDAMRYGAPPHGGLALGLDRIVALIAGLRLDPRRDRVPEDRERRRPADRRAGRGRPAAAGRVGPATQITLRGRASSADRG